MWRQSVWSSTIAAKIAAQFLKEGGLLSLPGAKPALGPTPGKMKLSHLTDERFFTDKGYTFVPMGFFLYVTHFLAIS